MPPWRVSVLCGGRGHSHSTNGVLALRGAAFCVDSYNTFRPLTFSPCGSSICKYNCIYNKKKDADWDSNLTSHMLRPICQSSETD